jgi:ADP-heptose:LPS heptosyltransferase
MGETAYKPAIVRPLSRWLKLLPSEQPIHLPLVGPEGGHVLFIQSGDITDLLFAAPLLTALHSQYPRCRIGVLVREDSSELIRHHPHVHDMIQYHPGRFNLTSPSFFALVRQLRKQHYDMVVHMGNAPEPAHEVLGYLCGAPVRIGPQHEGSYPYINCELRWDPLASGYEARRLGQVGGLLGLRAKPDRVGAVLTDQDLRFARQLIHFRKPKRDELLIGVDPGRGKARTKVMDRTLLSLVRALCKQHHCKVIVLATPEEEETAARFEQVLGMDRIELPRHNVKDVVSLVSQCNLFLAGNTNLFHFAVAFGVPSIGLFTERDGVRWTPPDLEHVAVIRGTRGAKLSLTDFLAKADKLLHAGQSA